ncbi:hypothetical protein D3C81_2052010 [compost metagenome]
MQAMTGIDDQPLSQAAGHAVGHALQLFGDFGRSLGIGITAGVQFDGRGTHALGSLDLPLIGIDK